jgi:hypothetical protein
MLRYMIEFDREMRHFMKPLPFELPAMICFDKESVAAQRETMEAEENNPTTIYEKS